MWAKQIADSAAYRISNFVDIHHRKILFGELLFSLTTLALDLGSGPLGLGVYAARTKTVLLVTLAFVLGAQVYLTYRLSDPANSMPAIGALRKLPRAELVRRLIDRVAPAELRTVSDKPALFDFAILHHELTQSFARPTWSGMFSTQSRQMEQLFLWYTSQPGALALLRPESAERRRYFWQKPQPTPEQRPPIGTCVVLAVTNEAAHSYLNGLTTAYDVTQSDLCDDGAAEYALLVGAALKPQYIVEPTFMGRAVFSHLAQRGLLRKGLKLLAPSADVRRQQWLEALEFKAAGKNAAGRIIYELEIGEEFV